MDKILIAFFSLLPALVYAFIIYVTVPYKTISIYDGLRFLLGGIFSVVVLKYLYYFVPDIDNQLLVLSGSTTAKYNMAYSHLFYFVKVGLFEELAKLISFYLFFRLMSYVNKEKMHPIGIMFYCGMVGLGFSVSENVHYATASYTPFITLGWRAMAPVLTHMVCGFFIGYWIGLGQLGPRLYNRSLFDIVINKRSGLRKFLYGVIGLFGAVVLHGLYDLHLSINGMGGLTGAYMLIILALLGVLKCFSHIYKLHNSKLEREKTWEESHRKRESQKERQRKNRLLRVVRAKVQRPLQKRRLKVQRLLHKRR